MRASVYILPVIRMLSELQGYRGSVLRALKDAGVVVGDLIRVTKEHEAHEGVLMPRYELADDQHIVLKLKNGYNIGIRLTEAILVEKIGEGAKPAFTLPPASKEKPGLPTVAIISTGGTIASRVDYHTGAVRPALSASDLASIVPELSEVANVKAEILYSLLSENVHCPHWSKIALTVANFIDSGADGVVICHGTDTLTYTASALSFALQNLPVPVILVGSQRSSDRPSSDAHMNLLNAVTAAARLPCAGVMVGMHETTSDTSTVLHLGTKVRKCHTSRRDAFRSINNTPLARVEGGKVTILHTQLPKRDKGHHPVVRPNFDENVALLKFYPGLRPEVFKWYAAEGYRGVILEGTGLGHIATYLLDEVESAVQKGLVLGMTSQCLWGRVNMNVYDTGMYLQKAGVIPLEDMLPETALVKMMWCFGQEEERDAVIQLLRKNIAGEISPRTLPEGMNA